MIPAKVPIFAAAVGFVLQLGLSEVLTGWSRRYTSPVYFAPIPDFLSRLFRLLPSKSVQHVPDMKGKVAIVTGANTGIGYETALELARAGATVIVAARSESKGLDAAKRIEEEAGADGGARYLRLDLASLDSVEEFARAFLGSGLDLHLLVLNAGVMKSPGAKWTGRAMTYGFDATKEGFEYHIGVNHIGHALLVRLLLEKLISTAAKGPDGARIVSVSSIVEAGAPEGGFAFEDWLPAGGNMPAGYEDGMAYGQSKLANLMYAGELARRLDGTGVSAYSCHPGIIRSDVMRHLNKKMEADSAKNGRLVKALLKVLGAIFESAMFDVKGGSLTQLHLATAPAEALENGGHYHPVGKLVAPSHPQARNETLGALLWEETDKAIEMRSDYKP
ncbi:hypothetical protein ACHAWF_009089 [Thalassiosira exigua]